MERQKLTDRQPDLGVWRARVPVRRGGMQREGNRLDQTVRGGSRPPKIRALDIQSYVLFRPIFVRYLPFSSSGLDVAFISTTQLKT
jgi:hypothetical protein